MKEAAQSLIVGPAKAVNPQIKVVIKYPNWYEHFAYAGFNLEAEPRIFDGIYTGTETRDPVLTHQHLQTYQSYSIMRYFENVKPGGNGGGWVDPFARITLDRYAEQIELTVLAKAREITLFCFSDLLSPIRQPDGSMKAASRVAPVAGETLERADALLSRLGNPVGVSAYKPYHSSGEDFLHSFLGMIGIPIELTPQFREDAPVVFLNESARFDPGIVSRIEKQLRAGKSVVITSGLLKALQGKGIEQIVDLEVSDRQVLTRRFSNFWGGVWEAERDILLPQLRYATNDSWEEITALAGRERLPPAAPRGLRERPPLRPHDPRQLRRPLRAARPGPRPHPARGHEGPPGAPPGAEPGLALRLRQRHVRRPLLPRPHGLRRAGGRGPGRDPRGPADGRPPAGAGARATRPCSPSSSSPTRTARSSAAGGAERGIGPRLRRQPAARAGRQHHRLRPDLAGSREGAVQGGHLREDPRGRLHLGARSTCTRSSTWTRPTGSP